MTFDEWMNQVNIEVSNQVGLDADDLADQPYYDWWEDGVRPKTAAKRALKDNGWGAYA